MIDLSLTMIDIPVLLCLAMLLIAVCVVFQVFTDTY